MESQQSRRDPRADRRPLFLSPGEFSDDPSVAGLALPARCCVLVRDDAAIAEPAVALVAHEVPITGEEPTCPENPSSE